ncbi:MAG: phage tail sheath C-terminal domain-containing protein [Cyanobacteria bacterium P01_D01_bin.116]
MPTRPTYPGVYIEEIPSGVRTITGVATSIAAFVGFFKRGPMNEPVQIFNLGDFERNFGGLDIRSEASYAIGQFFLNGGTEAWVVRTASDNPIRAAIEIKNAGNTRSVLKATAISEGEWGNNIRLDVDYATTDPDKTFNLVVTEVAVVAGRSQNVTTEIFRNLSMDEEASNYAVDVVNDGSKLIELELPGAENGEGDGSENTEGDDSENTEGSIPEVEPRPARTGTISDPVEINNGLVELAAQASMDVVLNSLDKNNTLTTKNFGAVLIGESSEEVAPTQLARRLQTKLRELKVEDEGEDQGKKLLSKATVTVVGNASTEVFLQIKPGTSSPSDYLSFSGDLAGTLRLNDDGRNNVQQYALGGGTIAAQAAAGETGEDETSEPQPQVGEDGEPPDATALIGDLDDKTGLYALQDVDIFNILCIPRTTYLEDTAAFQVIATATNFCEEQRAFYIVDVPHPKNAARDDVTEIKDWLDENATLRHKNTAVYYPRPLIANPLNNFRLRKVASSGTIAGLYARTDSSRGVWKAPAGTEATLTGVQKLGYTLTDAENGTLNPLGINCLRNFPIYGNVCWGARTLDGSDQQASEWKYIPIRRLALFMEESLFRGTQWVVFEPNDEPLWAQIRLNVGAFMNNLFRQGAFQGKSPNEAYFVKCDKETNPQNDIDRGIVNILVGYAPLKPAEFVIIKFQQIAGQLEV